MRNWLLTYVRRSELLWAWTMRGIRARYKQTLLGGLWAIIQPLALMIVFAVVFSFLFKVPSDGMPYPVFSYVALLPWTFFASSVNAAAPSLVEQAALVSKIYFPREILPFGAIGVAFLDFLLASLVFVGLLIFYHIPIGPNVLWVPYLVVIQVALTMGVGLLTSALNVFYRDVKHVIALGLQLWMYATPIIYPLSLVPAWLRPVYLLNPMAGIIDSYRRVVLLGTPPDGFALVLASVLSVGLLVVAWAVFKALEGIFADVI